MAKPDMTPKDGECGDQYPGIAHYCTLPAEHAGNHEDHVAIPWVEWDENGHETLASHERMYSRYA